MRARVMLALLLACASAQASEWVSLGKDSASKTMEFFVDVSSVVVRHGIRRAWFKIVYAPQTEAGSHQNGNKWVSYDLARWAFNCNEQTASAEALDIYYEDGTHEEDTVAPWPKPWRPIPPDTVMSTEMQFICAWKSK